MSEEPSAELTAKVVQLEKDLEASKESHATEKTRADVAEGKAGEMTTLLLEQQKQLEEGDKEPEPEPDPKSWIDQATKAAYEGLDEDRASGKDVIKQFSAVVDKRFNDLATQLTTQREDDQKKQTQADWLGTKRAQAEALNAKLGKEGQDLQPYIDAMNPIIEANPNLSVEQAFTLVKQTVDKEKGLNQPKEDEPVIDQHIDLTLLLAGKGGSDIKPSTTPVSEGDGKLTDRAGLKRALDASKT